MKGLFEVDDKAGQQYFIYSVVPLLSAFLKNDGSYSKHSNKKEV